MHDNTCFAIGARRPKAKESHERIPRLFQAYGSHDCVPDVLNAPLAHALGRTVAEVQSTNDVVLGRDAPLSGTMLHDALANGLRQAVANVTSIGLCGTRKKFTMPQPTTPPDLLRQMRTASPWHAVRPSP